MSNKLHIEQVLRRWAAMRDLGVEWINVERADLFPTKRVPYHKTPPVVMCWAREGNNEGHVIELFVDGARVLLVKTLGEDLTGAWHLGATFAAALTQRTQGTSYKWRVEKRGVAA